MHKTALVALVAGAGLLVTSPALSRTSAFPTSVNATVGPGFTISLTYKGKRVKTMKPGKHTFKLNDKSNIHNFHLSGPGMNKDLTSIGFVGKKKMTLKLKKGTYQYYCVPHRSTMHGSFKVK
jgi:plastocyanin